MRGPLASRRPEPVVTAFNVERRDDLGRGTAGVMVFGGVAALWQVEYRLEGVNLFLMPIRPCAPVYEAHARRVIDAIMSLAQEGVS